MYINLAWSRLDTTIPMEDIEGEILGAISSPAVRFVHFFTPWDGCFFACVRTGETAREIERLHQLLLPPSAGRFAYVITVSPNFQDLCRSADQTGAGYDKLVTYETA